MGTRRGVVVLKRSGGTEEFANAALFLPDIIKTAARRKDAWAGMRALRRELGA
jgi:hypothetical protein